MKRKLENIGIILLLVVISIISADGAQSPKQSAELANAPMAVLAPITLAWNANPDVVGGYRLYWATYLSTNSLTVGATTLTASVPNLPPRTTVRVWVTAFNLVGESPRSNVVNYRTGKKGIL